MGHHNLRKSRKDYMSSVLVGGLTIDNVSLDEAVKKAEELIQSEKHHLCVTLVTSGMYHARMDKYLKTTINSADLVICDGMGIYWLSKLFGTPLKERVTGVDLTIRLCEISSKKGYRIFLLGDTDEILNKTKKILYKRYKLTVETYSPPFREWTEEDEKIIFDKVSRYSPNILLLAIGFHRGENWLYRNLKELNVPFCMQVGGTFRIICGVEKRGPQWAQDIGLEGVYRTLYNPMEIIRYGKLIMSIIYSLYYYVMKLKRKELIKGLAYKENNRSMR